MPHGAPDWGLTGGKSTTYGSDDLHELGVRLGSIDTFDRRGEVIFHDDFGHGLNFWNVFCSIAGGDATPVITPVRSNPLAILLETPNDSDENQYLTRYQQYPAPGGLGIEASFAPDAETDYIQMNLAIQDNVDTVYYETRIFTGTGIFQVHHNDNTWPPVYDGLGLYAGMPIYITIKLVADTVSERYVRLLVNDVEVDLAAYNGYHLGGPGVPHMAVGLLVQTASDIGSDCYLDDVIFTQNEPIDTLP